MSISSVESPQPGHFPFFPVSDLSSVSLLSSLAEAFDIAFTSVDWLVALHLTLKPHPSRKNIYAKIHLPPLQQERARDIWIEFRICNISCSSFRFKLSS